MCCRNNTTVYKNFSRYTIKVCQVNFYTVVQGDTKKRELLKNQKQLKKSKKKKILTEIEPLQLVF